MEDTGEKRRKYGKYSDFLEDVWYNLWKIIKSYPLLFASCEDQNEEKRF